MNSQELNTIYPIVLPKPKEGFEARYYDILDNGWYELDKETRDATELIDNSELPILAEDILKIGKDEIATDWAETIYFNLLSEVKCVYEDEYWEIVKRLPDFYAAEGSRQKMKAYLLGINLGTFLELMHGMPVYRLALPNPAIPNYSMKGKGYHPENTSDWVNFDHTILKKCTNLLSSNSKAILGTKYLKPKDSDQLLQELNKDISKLSAKQNGNYPNGHLIIKYNPQSINQLHDHIKIHVLEDFYNWINYWTSIGYPIGLNLQFLIDR